MAQVCNDALSAAVGMLLWTGPPPADGNHRRREAADSDRGELGAFYARRAFEHRIYAQSAFDNVSGAAIQPRPIGPHPGYNACKFGRRRLPRHSAKTPSSEQQRDGNIDLLAVAVWAVQLKGRREITARLRSRRCYRSMYESTVRDPLARNRVDAIGC